MSHGEKTVAVIGGGLAGLTAALSLSKAGIKTLLIAEKEATGDARTTALLHQTVEGFEALDVWDDMSAHAYPLRTMRIVDAMGGVFHAPQVDFHASEIGLEAFGYNIANREAVSVLQEALSKTSVDWVDAQADKVQVGADGVTIEAGGKTFKAEFVIGADGRNSPTRDAAGIEMRTTALPQSAIVGNFEHTLSHGDVSTEFHTPTGPFTVVPLGKRQSSLVWVETPERGRELAAMELADLSKIIEDKMQSFLGKVNLKTRPRQYPLTMSLAKKFGDGPVALVGEAAHIFPPIGAQGFNLGMRDVKAIVELLKSETNWDSLGNIYHRNRSLDIQTRTAGVGMLNRSLLNSFLPIQIGRSAGLFALSSIGPLRRLAMREGIVPGAQLQHLRERLTGSRA